MTGLSVSKFSNIQFPIFCLTKTPVKEEIDFDRLYLTLGINTYLVDDRSLKIKSYFKRLLILRTWSKELVISFNNTCLNMQQLILAKAKWAYDDKGRIYRLHKRESFPCKSVKVKRIKDNLVWFDSISYPFEIPYEMTELFDKYMWIRLVYVESKWYIFDIEYTQCTDKYIKL